MAKQQKNTVAPKVNAKPAVTAQAQPQKVAPVAAPAKDPKTATAAAKIPPQPAADPITVKVLTAACRAFASLPERLADAQGFAFDVMPDMQNPGRLLLSPLAAAVEALGLLKPDAEAWGELRYMPVADPRWGKLVKLSSVKGARPNLTELLFDLQAIHDGIPRRFWREQAVELCEEYGAPKTIAFDAFQIADRTANAVKVADPKMAAKIEELAKRGTESRRKHIVERQERNAKREEREAKRAEREAKKTEPKAPAAAAPAPTKKAAKKAA